MEGFTDPPDADREFDELRRRAYGRDPDIGADPAALARLRELEAVPAIANTVASLVGPHPDATLHPIEEADGLVQSLLAFLGASSENSTIRGYEPYRGFEPWFFEDEQGFHCFMLVNRSAHGVDGANCVPPGVDLFADIGAWLPRENGSMEGLPDGSVIRFHYREESVDVFVYPASEAD